MWVHRLAKLVALSTLVLVLAGGMVTSTGSGLSVPDWPNSYGYFMFSFPLSFMVGGIFYEHGHRLIASTVGLLTIVLAVGLWRTDPRQWMKRLGLVTLAAVIVQGTLGGITVLYFLPAPISIAHAGIAQIFFCLSVSIALFTSPSWRLGYGRAGRDDTDSSNGANVDDAGLRRLTVGLTGLVFAQIIVGATMRHTGAGLAIPDFPLAFGGLLPSEWSGPVAIHFTHRIGAVLVLLLVVRTIRVLWRQHRSRPELMRPTTLLGVLVTAQITLGAFTIWTAKAPLVNTAHVGTGALVLVTSLVLALRAHRVVFATARKFGRETGHAAPEQRSRSAEARA